VPLAIWFHDAVYEPRPHDNEMRSAELVVDLPDPIGVPASVTEKVVRLIRPPSHHRLSDQPADQDTVTLLDVDLAILGGLSTTLSRLYRRTSARNMPGCLPASITRAASVCCSCSWLARIYYHPFTFEHYEDCARDNRKF
jgi:predicted metal-dependent HD superfamily phosphohydrolase